MVAQASATIKGMCDGLMTPWPRGRSRRSTARISGAIRRALPFGAQSLPACSRVHDRLAGRDGSVVPGAWSADVIRFLEDVANDTATVVSCVCVAFPVRSAVIESSFTREEPECFDGLYHLETVCLSNRRVACLI